MKKAVLWRRGEARERNGGAAGGVNPVTLSGEHSGVVRGLYKTLSMNDSKHLNDRETRRGGSLCVCVWLWVTVKWSSLIFWEVSEYIHHFLYFEGCPVYSSAKCYVLYSLLIRSITAYIKKQWLKGWFEKQTMDAWEWGCQEGMQGVWKRKMQELGSC